MHQIANIPAEPEIVEVDRSKQKQHNGHAAKDEYCGAETP
jgi:hypothetical protein